MNNLFRFIIGLLFFINFFVLYVKFYLIVKFEILNIILKKYIKGIKSC